MELRLEQQRALYLLLQGELPQLQLAPMQRQAVSDMVQCVSMSLAQLSSCIAALGRESCIDKTIRIVRLASEVDMTSGRVSGYARHLLAGLRDHPWRVQSARLDGPGEGLTPEQVRSIPLVRGAAWHEAKPAVRSAWKFLIRWPLSEPCPASTRFIRTVSTRG